jgi:hypothetical protein
MVLNYHSRFSGSWDAGFKNEVELFAAELRNFGLAQIMSIGSGDYVEMERHGTAAFDIATTLVSYLESR